MDESGDTCAKHTVAGISVVHEHKADSIMEQMVMSTEGLIDEEKDKLRRLLREYKGIILLHDGDIGHTSQVFHHIDTGEARPIKQSLRRLPFNQRREVKDLIDAMLEKKVIEPSQSPWCSPIVLVKKKDGSTRFCVDFRQVNAVTRKDAQPLPRIDDTLDVLGSAKSEPGHFCLPQVKYLGHIVSAKGIQPDPAKLEAVTKYPTPRNIEELRAFLGLENYYRRFVQSYAQIAGPLYNLTRKSIASGLNAGLHDVGGRITRWILFLQQFDFTIVYKPGRSNGNADALSRVPGVEKHLVNVISGLDVLGDQDQIRKFQRDDEVIARTIQAIIRNINLPQQLAKLKKELVVKNGVLCRCFQATKGDNPVWQVVVPVTLRDSVLKKLHDESGHLGLKKTLSKIQERVYWTGYEDDVRRWIQECGLCQRRNAAQPPAVAPLGTISAQKPFQKLTWDIMGPLPVSSKGAKYMLVVTDVFSKWVEAFAIPSTGAEVIADKLVKEVICRYGVPEGLHSDQGANLRGEVVQKICDKLGIHRTQTSAYHPQGNGQV
ncbi:hypothetical protein EMCRGX_G030034 [Ephydatia muelleri]